MLNLTKSERRAILIAGIILISSIIVQWLKPHQAGPSFYDYSMQDSLFKALSADTADSVKRERLEQPAKHQKVNEPKKKLKEKSININTAGLKELEKLPRIGPVTAQKILELRIETGGFKKVEDLLKVKGIGPKTLEKIRPYIIPPADSLKHN